MPSHRPHRTRLASLKPVDVTVAVSLLLIAPEAMALGSDTVFISGSGGVTYDSNVFRLSSDLTPQQVQQTIGSPEKHDTIYTLSAGVSADVPYSRQRLQANINVTDYKYNTFSYLDYVGGSGQAAWLWQVGDDWNGDLGVQASRALQNYSYYVTTARNIIDRVTYYFDPKYRIAPNWEVRGGLSYGTVRNSLASVNTSDYNQWSGSLGTGYVTPSGNDVGLQVQTAKVSFPNLIFFSGSLLDNAYRDDRLSTYFDWRFSGASKIDGSWGYTERKHVNLPQRDFQGWTGSVGWSWTPTDKTSVRTLLLRDIGGLEDIAVTYARTYSFTVTPTYQLTAKMGLSGTLQYQDILFLGNTGFGVTDSSTDRHDRVALAGGGLTYQATRTLQFGLSYAWSRRNSNVQFGGYDDQTVSLSAQVRF